VAATVIYTRFQPPGLSLEHTSETSESTLPSGFVFAYDGLEEPLWGDWSPFKKSLCPSELEVLTFEGGDAYDPGDAEGVAVRPLRLVSRETPRVWLERIEREGGLPEYQQAARKLLQDL
jgi:hypothetical protein